MVHLFLWENILKRFQMSRTRKIINNGVDGDLVDILSMVDLWPNSS